MKTLILLLLFPIAIQAQDFMEQGRLFMLKVEVTEREEFGSFITKDTTLIWGTNFGDTTCFAFNGRVKCFYRLKTKEDREGLKPSDGKSKSEDQVYLRKDRFDEVYAIRFVTCEDGLIIFIIHLELGIPNYVFRWQARVGE